VTLLARDLLGSDRLAGMAGAAFTMGSALTMIPLAAYMQRRGRRPGLAVALLVGAAGAAIAATGGQLRWFPVFILGMFAFGSAQAATLQQRYVAGDLAAPEQQARSIAAIVWVGTIGAVAGPLLTPLERRVAAALGLDELVGPFLFATVFLIGSSMIVWSRLRPDPLAITLGLRPDAERVRPIHQLRSSARTIRSSPGAGLGLAAMALSQAAMVAVMTMTPPHMDDHGHENLSAIVIAVHILGMFGLAPFVGRFVERAGPVIAIQVGAVVLGGGTIATVVAGYVPALMFVGLFLLGLGWNIGLIGGSTLLTTSIPGTARVEVQGTADLTMSMSGALAALGSGFVKESLGFHLLANGATALAAVLLVLGWITAGRVPAARAR